MTNEERVDLAVKQEALRVKIAAFFSALNKDELIAVQSVNLTWIEHRANGEHDFYLLTNTDITVRL